MSARFSIFPRCKVCVCAPVFESNKTGLNPIGYACRCSEISSAVLANGHLSNDYCQLYAGALGCALCGQVQRVSKNRGKINRDVINRIFNLMFKYGTQRSNNECRQSSAISMTSSHYDACNSLMLRL